MVLKKLISFFLFIASSVSLISQDLVETFLTSNTVLVRQSTQAKARGEEKAYASIYDTISLIPLKGILDDFSYDSPYPDTTIWLDQTAFINRGYGKAPFTIGVATFDGLNEKGYPYNFVVSNTSSLPADSLTSKPIDLNYVPGDSLYLSFFYQPQGIGEKPETADSLVLEFKAPGPDSISTWKHIWSESGRTLAVNDSSWGRVMIPITDTAFLKKGFQFRFRNYATLSGNLDHWHIDYVYLNTLRTVSDTIFSDVSWVYNGSPLLSNYTSMPWKQYKQSELRSNFSNLIRNNFNDTQNIHYYYEITDDVAVSTIGTFDGTVNILAYEANKVYTDCDIPLGCISSVPNSTGVFPNTLTEESQFTVKHFYEYINEDFIFENDTIVVVQEFSNYYAYDDGTAESAVGLSVLDAQLAEKYTLNVSDSLQAIDIYFNPIVDDATLYAFILTVWDDNGGEPGDEVYTSSSALTPIYNNAGQNSFARYLLEAPMLLAGSTYYFGFTQKTNQFLNVGQDKNINNQDKTFYNVGSGWNASPLYGSVMIHPVLGTAAGLVGVESHSIAKENRYSIYPNPVDDKLFIKSTSASATYIDYSIVDLFGRTILQSSVEISSFIDVSFFDEGVYFITFQGSDSAVTLKFIKIN